jgi:hypothetical protein
MLVNAIGSAGKYMIRNEKQIVRTVTETVKCILRNACWLRVCVMLHQNYTLRVKPLLKWNCDGFMIITHLCTTIKRSDQ